MTFYRCAPQLVGAEHIGFNRSNRPKFQIYSTRKINCINQSSGRTIWQHHYYVRLASPKEIHIIRGDRALYQIRQHIQNPRFWQQDQLHPNNLSKW